MSTTEPTNKTLTLTVEEKERLKRRAAERWTLPEAAAELSEQLHQVMSPADWLAVLEKLVPTEFVHSPNGEVEADELNTLLDAHPRWKALGTPRLPSARKTAEHVAGAWGYSMHAAYWFDMAAVTPREAAGLLCQNDPLFEKANPENNTNDETGPNDFRLLLRVFSDVERSEPGCKTLLEWLAVAKVRGCRHHSWIDKYLDAREQLGCPIAEDSAAVTPNEVPKVPAGVADAAHTVESTSVPVIESPPVVQATDADDLSKTIETERLLELARLEVRDEYRARKHADGVDKESGDDQCNIDANELSDDKIEAEEATDAYVDKGYVFKKKALIQKHLHHWPSIVDDFQHYDTNGLGIAAKATRHGEYFETPALSWAKKKGKLTDEIQGRTVSPSAMDALPRRKIKGV